MPRFRKLLLATLLVLGCRPVPLSPAEAAGTYSFELNGHTDLLTLRPDGTYLHAYGAEPVEGRWRIDSMQGTTWLHLGGFDPWWQPGTPRGELATFFQRRDGTLEIRVPGAPVWYRRR